MASFGGFIASALGGAAKGYGEGAQMEMKKQAELDLKKQLLDAETERNLRIDDIKRQRDVSYARAETAYNQNPETIAAAAKAQAAKFDELIKAGVPAAEARLLVAQGTAAAGTREALAPVDAAADVVVGRAKAGTRETLAPVNAAAAVAEGVAAADVEGKLAIPQSYADAAKRTAKANMNVLMAPIELASEKYVFEVQKEFRDLKAKDATDAQITKAKALVADKDYMAALEKTDLATHAGVIRVAQIKADSFDERTDAQLEKDRLDRIEKARKNSERGGSTVPTTADLQRQVSAAENALASRIGVKKADLNEELARLQKSTSPASKATFDGAAAERAALDAARKRLLEWSKKPKEDAAPAAAAASNLPPLRPGMFETKK